MAVRDIIQAAGGSAATSAAVYVEDVFSTYLYSGTGSSQTITNGIDLSTKGGMVWIKNRNGSSYGDLSHYLQDTDRGITYSISSNDTAQQYTQGTGGVTSVGTTGFTIGNAPGWNDSSYLYTSWTFRKQAKFFDIVTYTGTGSARTISHALGSSVGMVIVKRTDTTGNWQVYHKSLTSAANSIQLNLTNAQASATTVWNSTAPTSTVFSVGTDATVNASGGTYVAYLFADSNSGGFGPAGTDSIVACGSFTTDGTGKASINLGWEPQFFILKSSGSSENWFMFDTMRGISTGGVDKYVLPNFTSGEYSVGRVEVNATGFATTAMTASYNYIYLAIRRGPMKTPTDATKVFSPNAVNVSAGTKITTGFPVDTQLMRALRGNSRTTYVIDRLRGVSSNNSETSTILETSQTSAEFTSPNYALGWDNTGYKADSGFAGVDNIYWNFRRAPGFFDVVCYTGTGSATTVAHNLGVAPELMIVKRRSNTSNWFTYNVFDGPTKYLSLNVTDAVGTSSAYWNNTSPTASAFTIGGASGINYSGDAYVAYLFATCPGVSKVFNFTGNGSSQTINCGFASGARFVLIKRTDAAGDWWVYDSARGIVSAADPALALNSTAAEVTSADAIDPDSSGFIVNQEATCNVNVNNATYVGLAIA